MIGDSYASNAVNHLSGSRMHNTNCPIISTAPQREIGLVRSDDIWTDETLYGGIMSIRTLVATSGTLALVVGSMTIAAGPASAADLRGCAPDTGYSFSGVATTNLQKFIVYGAGNVTLSVSEASGTTITGTVTGAATTEVGFIVAKASVTVSSSISLAKTTTSTISGSWKTPASGGWLAYGAQGRSMNWKYGSYNGACTYIVARSGTAKLPTLAPYIYHS